MIFEGKKPVVALVFALVAGMIGGCLTKEESGVEAPVTNDTPLNSAPSISGSPDNAVMIGGLYDFTPVASDADGDTLTFSIENPPRWTSFNTSTGRLSGQPLLGDEGVYDQIVISVSDGSDSSSLSAFSITATQVALGSMTLSWIPPVENTDGTTLVDLFGYRLYFGVSEGNYPNRIELDTAGIASYVVENLLPDTYYVVITSVNASGVESIYSNVVTRIVEVT